jgi:hypothetical protein
VRRLFWLALGATAGVLVVRKVSRTAQAYTPAGLAHAVSGLGDSVRHFADQVRQGMVEREAQLRDALGLEGDGGGSTSSGDHIGTVGLAPRGSAD